MTRGCASFASLRACIVAEPASRMFGFTLILISVSIRLIDQERARKRKGGREREERRKKGGREAGRDEDSIKEGRSKGCTKKNQGRRSQKSRRCCTTIHPRGLCEQQHVVRCGWVGGWGRGG